MNSKEQPAPPVGGVPPQRTPLWVRVMLRSFVFLFMSLDLLVQALLYKVSSPHYRVEGGCLQRGNCCHYILMEWDPLMERWPWLGRFWLWWYTQIHGFYLRDFDLENTDGRVARVMGCRHLGQDGRCKSYRLRPAICRQWPRREYAGKPFLLKGCGYRAIPQSKDALEYERKLQEESLSKVRSNLGLEQATETIEGDHA